MTETATTITHDRVSKCKRLRDFIIKINLFENKATLSLIDQLFATRIFLSLLIISLTIIVVFTGFTFQTHIVTIQSPSENTFRQLYIQYSNTLSCLCTQSSILQNEFISFNPQYHPICTSQFVNQTFISSLSDYNMSDYWPLDYRTMAASHFLVLATLCRTVTQMVSDVLEEFTSQYISTNQVLSQDIFDGQITALIAKLKAMTIADNKYTSDFVLFNIFRNEIISGLRTNYFMRVVPGTSTYSTNISQYQTLNTTCSCDRNITCVHQAGIYNGTGRVGLNLSRTFGNLINDPLLLLTIPGIMVGCLPYTSLLQSTLECFYYQSCINQIQTFINGFSLVLPLVSTYFQQNTTVSDLFDQLFIESWNEMSNFSDYFRACSPYLCTYSYDRRYDILYVIVTIISLFGGLRIILFYFAPFIVKIIRRVQKTKYCQKNSDEIITVIPVTPNQSLKDRFISLVRQIRQEIVTFNMFPLSSDIRDGIYSTRLYFFLLSIGIVILVFYSSLSIRIQSVTIYTPSLSEYERLYAEYPSALICPCTQLSVAHSLIIDIKPSYHQVCSSDFVKDDVWLLYFSGIKGSLYSADFRTIGFPLFTILQTLCMMSNETVTNQLIVFNNTQFVSGRVLTRDTFNSQTYHKGFKHSFYYIPKCSTKK